MSSAETLQAHIDSILASWRNDARIQASLALAARIDIDSALATILADSGTVDPDHISYVKGTKPSTSGVAEGTIGAYFTSNGFFQKLKLVSGVWTDIGEPILNKDSIPFINPKWFGAKGDGATNDWQVFEDILSGSDTGVLVIPDGTYKFNKSVNLRGWSIIGQSKSGVVFDFSDVDMTYVGSNDRGAGRFYLMYSFGSYEQLGDLASDGTKGDRTITLESAPTLNQNDMLAIFNPQDGSYNAQQDVYRDGELNFVKAVDGADVDLVRDLVSDYETDDEIEVYKITPHTALYSNFTILEHPTHSGDFFSMGIMLHLNTRFENIKFGRRAHTRFRLVGCYGLVLDGIIIRSTTGVSNNYGIYFSGCYNTVTTNCDLQTLGHSYDCGGAIVLSGGLIPFSSMVNRFNTFSDSYARRVRNHGNIDHWSIENVTCGHISLSGDYNRVFDCNVHDDFHNNDTGDGEILWTENVGMNMTIANTECRNIRGGDLITATTRESLFVIDNCRVYGAGIYIPNFSAPATIDIEITNNRLSGGGRIDVSNLQNTHGFRYITVRGNLLRNVTGIKVNDDVARLITIEDNKVLSPGEIGIQAEGALNGGLMIIRGNTVILGETTGIFLRGIETAIVEDNTAINNNVNGEAGSTVTAVSLYAQTTENLILRNNTFGDNRGGEENRQERSIGIAATVINLFDYGNHHIGDINYSSTGPTFWYGGFEGRGVKNAYSSSIPTVGTFGVGDKIFDTTPNAGGKLGWVCTTAGTLGTLSGVTGSITSGEDELLVSAATNLYVGMYITIAGVSGVFRIIKKEGTTLTLSGNADATVSGASVAYSAATLKPMGAIDA